MGQKITQLRNKCKECSLSDDKDFVCNRCIVANKLIERYFEANIPVDFWFKNISSFKGDSRLVDEYNAFVSNIDTIMVDGFSLFLKGRHGVGKTMISCLFLKKIVQAGRSGLYCTLSDVVSVIVNGNNEDKSDALRELKMTDFLVLDEFDPRFFKANETSAELFGRILEGIIRIRFQNHMPTILITNNPDPIKDLGSDLGASISSLVSGYSKTISVIGPDFRKTR
jgi:DNA replication protein DnaC